MTEHPSPGSRPKWEPTAARLALELAESTPAEDESFVQWVERHAKRYLVVVREAERLRCAKIAARVGNAGDYRTMAVAHAIVLEIEKDD